MDLSTARARSTSRRLAGRLARRLARRNGLALVPAEAAETAAPEDPATATVPRGRVEPFSTDEYDVVPKGRYDLVPRNYYSPVPDLDSLPADVWERRSPLGGIDLRVDAAIELIEAELAPYVAELAVPESGPAPAGTFFLRNENYESVDAELLYATLRARKPRRVLELGSGFTTLLIGEACRRNAADGQQTEHVAFDPFPRAQILGEKPPEPTVFEPVPATDVPLERFAELEAGDVLFVDTTHTVKLGSDVNYIVLDVLPTLAPGVLVHFHDIFLPWEYPRAWFEEMQYYWAEQYLLQAFLAFNEAFEIVLPAMAVAREHPERLKAVVPTMAPGTRPGAFWIKRR
jgi:Methyltransferase domain